jgi:hypothetical protein
MGLRRECRRASQFGMCRRVRQPSQLGLHAKKRACSRRAKQAQATGVAAFSSWPTPTALDSGHFVDLMAGNLNLQPVKTINLGPASTGQMPLSNAARGWTAMWMVLKAMGWQASDASHPYSHPVRVTLWNGNGSLTNTLISNPSFYELIMGWPIGWTKAELAVTGFAAWLQRSRGQFLKLISLPMQEACNDA